MLSATTASQQTEIRGFLQTSLRALVRAEAAGRIPLRFTGTGQDVWNTFRNELTAADLVALSIQDAGATMPVPFDPGLWWPNWPDWALRGQSSADAEGWIAEALAQASQPRDDYLCQQAVALGIDLPVDEAMAALPTPRDTNAGWNCPAPVGGWPMFFRPGWKQISFWENFRIVCGTPQEDCRVKAPGRGGGARSDASG
jgi:hypothetical protein